MILAIAARHSRVIDEKISATHEKRSRSRACFQGSAGSLAQLSDVRRIPRMH
jgi:hypothetical protein